MGRKSILMIFKYLEEKKKKKWNKKLQGFEINTLLFNNNIKHDSESESLNFNEPKCIKNAN